MHRYFPSRKVFVVGVLAIGLLAWSIVHTGASQQNSAITDNFLGTVANAEVSFSDADKDGLYDWEESILGTNPEDTDSNNDGVEDGEEYELPKTYAQLDVVSDEDQLGLSRAGNAQNINPDNLSETLLTEAVSDYASLGGNVPNETSREIVNDLARNFDTYELKIKYNLGDVSIADPKDENANSTYLIEFLAALGENKEIYEMDALEIASANESGSKGVELLEELRDSYYQVTERLLLQEVPHEIAIYHTALLNIFHNSAEVLEDVKQYDTDPLKSMAAAAAYTQFQSDRAKVIVDLTVRLSELFQ